MFTVVEVKDGFCVMDPDDKVHCSITTMWQSPKKAEAKANRICELLNKFGQ